MPLSSKTASDFATAPIPIHEIKNGDYEMVSFRLEYGFDRIHRRQFNAKRRSVPNAYPDFWAVFIADLPPGVIVTLREGRRIHQLSGKCVIYIPEKTLLNWETPPGWTEWTIFTSIHPIPAHFPKNATVIRPKTLPDFGRHTDMMDFLSETLPAQNQKPAEPSTSRHYERVMDYINAHFQEDITIAKISADLGIPPSTMTHEFKRAYGIPPMEYIHTLRVFGILSRVSMGDETTKVTKDFGYQDYSNLYRQFMKFIKQPPSTFSRRGFAPKGKSGGVDLKSIEKLSEDPPLKNFFRPEKRK